MLFHARIYPAPTVCQGEGGPGARARVGRRQSGCWRALGSSPGATGLCAGKRKSSDTHAPGRNSTLSGLRQRRPPRRPSWAGTGSGGPGSARGGNGGGESPGGRAEAPGHALRCSRSLRGPFLFNPKKSTNTRTSGLEICSVLGAEASLSLWSCVCGGAVGAVSGERGQASASAGAGSSPRGGSGTNLLGLLLASGPRGEVPQPHALHLLGPHPAGQGPAQPPRSLRV